MYPIKWELVYFIGNHKGAKSWSGYGLSAWLENGQPSPALDAFRKKTKNSKK